MPEAELTYLAAAAACTPKAGLRESLFCLERGICLDAARAVSGLEMILDSESACAPVAVAEGDVVGTCSGQQTISMAEGGPAVLMEDMVARRGWRGQGIGKALVRELTHWSPEQRIQSREPNRLMLLAARSLEGAIHFKTPTGGQLNHQFRPGNRTI